MTSGSEFNINKVWDFIESKPFNNKDYSPMFSTAKEIYDKFGEKELEMYTNFQWNGRDTPIHRKELANLQRIKTMDGASKMRENKMKLSLKEKQLVKEYAIQLMEVRTAWNNRFENLSTTLQQRYSEMSPSDQKLKDSIFWSYYRYYNDGDKLGFAKADLQKVGCSDKTINSLDRSVTANIRRQTKPYSVGKHPNKRYIYPTGYKPDIDKYEAAMEDVIKCTIKYFVKKYPTFFNKSGRQKTIYKWKEEIIDHTKRDTGELNTYWVAEFAKQFNVEELKKYADLKKSGVHTINDKSEINKILRIMLNSSFDSFERLGESKLIKESNTYTMVSALREVADDFILQTELLIDKQYGKLNHEEFKNVWYKNANAFENKFMKLINNILKANK